MKRIGDGLLFGLGFAVGSSLFGLVMSAIFALLSRSGRGF